MAAGVDRGQEDNFPRGHFTVQHLRAELRNRCLKFGTCIVGYLLMRYLEMRDTKIIAHKPYLLLFQYIRSDRKKRYVLVLHWR